MKINRIYPENASRKQQYDLTSNPTNRKLSICEGQRLDVAAWCLYEDVDVKTGELRELLSIATPEHEIYCTNSVTCIREFTRMLDLFGDDGVTAIEVVGGESKNGRRFFTVVYAGE